jgi:hypothetical protein
VVQADGRQSEVRAGGQVKLRTAFDGGLSRLSVTVFDDLGRDIRVPRKNATQTGVGADVASSMPFLFEARGFSLFVDGQQGPEAVQRCAIILSA